MDMEEERQVEEPLKAATDASTSGNESDRLTPSYNDIDLRQWREYDDIETESLWLINGRERSNGHRLEYHGNFVPQVATQALRRFTRAGDLVLDLFLGAGTTAIEAERLGRRCLGVELKPDLVEQVRSRLPGAISTGQVVALAADSAAPETARQVRQAMQEAWNQDLADLVILHPPYSDIIRFSDDPADLSNAGDDEAFLDRFRAVAGHAFDLLRPGRFAVLVIGDKYRRGELVPLGFLCMQAMNHAGFRTKSIVVKNIVGNEIGKGKDSNLWRYRALAHGFYIFRHEYVIFFRKPL
jgi:predicted RNA methylase